MGIMENAHNILAGLPEWVKNLSMYAVSGFLAGFCMTFVANPVLAWPDLSNSIYLSLVAGLYSAAKEVLAHVETSTRGKITTAGASVPAKTLVSRMI